MAIKVFPWFLTAILWISCGVASSAEVPLPDFTRIDTFADAEISPDGRYVAFRVPAGNANFGLAVLDAQQGKIVGRFGLGEDRTVASYTWSSSTRLIVTLGETFGEYDIPLATGELIAVDFDGKRWKYLFGYRGQALDIGTRIGVDTDIHAFGSLVRTLPDNPGEVIIQSFPFARTLGAADRMRAQTWRLYTVSGRRESEVGSPLSGEVSFLADANGFVRYVVGDDRDNIIKVYVRSPEAPEWKLLSSGEKSDRYANVKPLRVTRDNRYALLMVTGSEGLCLTRESLASGQRSTIACEKTRDVSEVVYSADGEEPIGFLFEIDRPRVEYFDPAHSSAKIMTALERSFPGQMVQSVSRTRDGSKLVIEVSSDRNPGDYYLFDTQKMKASYLIGKNRWIDPEQMAERRPFVMHARDGTELHGYLTIPRDRKLDKLPMIVHPHGGPLGIYDTWSWESDPQMLASRGYLVLQVNFRGSGNYGKKFINAGRGGYDTVMIDDITDATRWAVAQGYADATRLCIYGGSYGAYASLMSAVKEPDLYRCVVGYAGVYDLQLFRSDSAYGDMRSGRNFIDANIGDSPDRLAEASPINRLDRLKAPMLIIHGTKDPITPISQAEALMKAMDKRKLPYESLINRGEGHGFYLPEDRLEVAERLLAFVQKTIGAGAPPTEEPAPAASP